MGLLLHARRKDDLHTVVTRIDHSWTLLIIDYNINYSFRLLGYLQKGDGLQDYLQYFEWVMRPTQMTNSDYEIAQPTFVGQFSP